MELIKKLASRLVRFTPIKVIDIDQIQGEKGLEQQKNGPNSFYIKVNSFFSGDLSLKDALVYSAHASVVIHFLQILLTQPALEQSFELWKPKIRQGATRNGSCVLRSDIQQVDYMSLERNPVFFEQLSQFRSLNNVTKIDSFMEYFLVEMLIHYCVMVAFIIQISKKNSIRIASLSFILDPAKVREKMRSDSAQVIARSFDLNQSIVQGFDRRGSERDQMGGKVVYLDEKFERVRGKGHNFNLQLNRRNFLRMLSKEKLHQIIMPSCLSDSRLKLYTFVLRIIFWLVTLSINATLVTSFSHHTLFQLEERFSALIQKANCERWNPEAQVAKETFNISNEFWLKHRQKYYSFKLGQDSKFPLYWLEFKEIFPITSYVRFIIDYLIYQTMGQSWSALVALAFAGDLMIQVNWLSEVQEQIQASNKLMVSLIANSDLRKSNPRLNLEAIRELQIMRRFHFKRIERQLAIAFVNFELFRIHYKDFRFIANQIAAAISILGITIFANIFFIQATRNKFQSQFLFWIITFVLMFITNGLFASSLLIIIKLQRISKELLLCFARSCELSINQSYIIGLWRKQLLNDKETRAQYALSFMSFELSPKNFFTLLSYLIAISIIGLKSSEQEFSKGKL